MIFLPKNVAFGGPKCDYEEDRIVASFDFKGELWLKCHL